MPESVVIHHLLGRYAVEVPSDLVGIEIAHETAKELLDPKAQDDVVQIPIAGGEIYYRRSAIAAIEVREGERPGWNFLAPVLEPVEGT
jgi:hypothetical protein